MRFIDHIIWHYVRGDKWFLFDRSFYSSPNKLWLECRKFYRNFDMVAYLEFCPAFDTNNTSRDINVNWLPKMLNQTRTPNDIL